MKFEIKNRFNGSVIFEAEIECSADAPYGTKLGHAVSAAIKAGANLADANLARADLRGANLAGVNLAGANLARANLAGVNLAGANLTYANLTYAYLAGAYLAGADLTDANLTDAYLTGANLTGANLTGANLTGAKWRDGVFLTKAPIQIYGLTWPVTVLDTHMQIGCQLHSHAEWCGFDDRKIAEMDGRNALKFWRDHKNTLLALCDAHAPKKASETEAA